MHTVLLIAVIHALALAFAFFTAGYIKLGELDPEETAAFKQRYQLAIQRGRFATLQCLLQHQREFSSLRKLALHLVSRRDARKLLMLAALFFALAALLGFPLGAYQ